MEKAMNKTACNKKLVCISAVLFALFVIFTILAKVCDVGPLGAGGGAVGFSHINSAFNARFPQSRLCYKITQYLGYACVLVAAMNAMVALFDLIRTKSLKKMDRTYLATMVLYAAVVCFYVFFEVVVINVRPTEPEASYPSSHTMLAICVLYSQTILFRRVERGILVKKALTVLCWIAMFSMAALRLLSGVHWLTDIMGAVLLSASLLTCYRAFTD